jgi:SdrD B-like domain/Subtilase family/CARDB/FG-GAP-like repeat/Cadherin domain/RTX calcium-binding nonapeptide repeat (4 copies)
MLNNPQVLQLVYQYLIRFARSADFESSIESIYGTKIGSAAIQQQWLDGQFSLIPEIRILTNGELGTANGAYSADPDEILVSSDFLARNAGKINIIAELLLEEIAHKLDRVLNGNVNNPGNKGAMFRLLATRDGILGGTGSGYISIDNSTDTAGIIIDYQRVDNGTITGGVNNGTTFKNISGVTVITGSGNDTINVSASQGGIIESGAGDDIIIGSLTGFGSSYYGDEGNDKITAGNKDSSLYGGTGNDTLIGGLADDNFEPGTGADSIDGGAGRDYLIIDNSTDPANTIIDYQTLDNGTITGGVNNGTTFKYIESVTLTTGSGNDTINVAASRYAGVHGGAGDDTIVGSLSGDGAYYGDEGNDKITAGNGNNRLDGGTGNDTLIGGTGKDYFQIGGTGNYYFKPGTGADSIDGGAGDDTLTIYNSTDAANTIIDYQTIDNGTITGGVNNGTTFKNIEEIVLDTGAGNDTVNIAVSSKVTLNTGAGNDIINVEASYAPETSIRINSGTGNDIIVGRLIADGYSSYDGGDGNDKITAGDVTGDNRLGDNLDGGAGNDTLIGGTGDDSFVPGTGADRIDGRGGYDRLSIYNPTDTADTIIDYQKIDNGTIDGGSNNGTTFKNIEFVSITTGSGNDIINVAASRRTNVRGGAGDDIIIGNLTDSVDSSGLRFGSSYDGEDGNDTITGGKGYDRLKGGAGNDTLCGVDKNGVNPGSGEFDTLEGDIGSDLGDIGSDLFILGDSKNFYYDDNDPNTNGKDSATVNDFNPSKDVIQLHGSATDYVLSSPYSYTELYIRKSDGGPDELIATFQGVKLTDLNSSAFKYVGSVVPTKGNVAKTGTEDQSISFSASDFTSAFGEAALAKIQIIALPTNGVLKLNNINVAVNQEILTADLGTLTFAPNPNYNGPVVFSWNGFDGNAYAANPSTVSISIAAVNDAPELVNAINDVYVYGNNALNLPRVSNYFRDVDLDNLTYTATLADGSPLPSWLTLNGTSFSGTPPITSIGQNIEIKVTAKDPSNATVTDNFVLGIISSAPFDIDLSNDNIAENSANGTVIGTLTSRDPNLDDTHTYTLVNDAGGRFAIDNNRLTVASGKLLDYETNTGHTIRVKSTDSSGLTYERDLSIAITSNNDNNAPFDISLSSGSIAENSANGTVIGTLTSADPNLNDTHTYTLVNDAGGRFAIDNNRLTVASGNLLDYETNTQHTIRVKSTDSGGLAYERDLNITITNINDVSADLIVSAANSPASAVLGQPITVAWTVTNQGTVPAVTDWLDEIYLSDDQILDPTDIRISSYNATDNSPLAVGGSYVVSQNIKLPNTTTGDKYLIIATDDSKNQEEIDETNNIRAVPISVSAPDLVVSNITTAQAILSGQSLEVVWTVTNQGAAAANGSWTDYVYLSTYNSGGNDLKVGSFDFTGSIAAGQSIERRQTITLPLNLNGQYRVVVTTNAGNILSEGGNEANNTTIDDRPIQITLAPLPNLVVSSVIPPATAFSGQKVLVQWTVANIGTGATNASQWYDRVYLSLDKTLDPSDTLLGTKFNPSYLNAGESYNNNSTVTLPNGINGNYYFLVKTDDFLNNVIELGNEDDNLGVSDPTNVNLTPPPDLQVTLVNAPAGAFSGQPMELTWTVTNQGTGRILEDRWSDRVFVSDDATLDGSDTVLGNFVHNGTLNSGQSYTGTGLVNLPIGVAGNKFFFVQSDINNQVYENIFENNNTNYDTTPTNISLTPPPDLEFETIFVPKNARSGSNLSIDYRVTNFGATSTPNARWNDTFYLSADKIFDPKTDPKLGSVIHYGQLNPAQGYNNTANLTLSNTLTGNYYIFGVTDGNDEVFELDNANNVIQSTEQIQIVSQPADLIVTEAIIPATGEAGKTISVKWTVKNQGTGDTIASSWTDRIIISKNDAVGDIISGDDIEIATVVHEGILAPNASYTQTQNINLPLSLEGNYRLFVVTDTENTVYEASNEGNNQPNFPIAITRQLADLQVTAIDAPITAASGTDLNLSWTVKNAGLGRTNNNFWYDNIYLSLDSTISGDDLKLDSVFRSNGLDPGSSYTAAKTFTLPFDFSGNYNVLVRTDRDNNVTEGAFENNNIKVSDNQIAISLSQVPDLTVQSVNAPDLGIAGQSLNLTWTVANNGANTSQTWYDSVYLSRDKVLDRKTDTFLGYHTRTSGLNAGSNYSNTQSFDIPRGLGGKYYAFVMTDSKDDIYERTNESNNINLDESAIEIIIPPPTDLVVKNITVPVTGILGQDINIGYTVQNQGTDTAIGSWTDSVYLSSDDKWDIGDVLVGEVKHSGDVAGGASYTGVLQGKVPSVNLGNYHAIVRTDIRNLIPEVNEENNIGVSSDKVTLNVKALTLGTADSGTLTKDQSIYYRFDATAGQAIRLKLNSSNDESANDLYVRYGNMPTRAQFDFTTTQPFNADPEIVVPIEKTGTYYVLAYGDSVIGTPTYEIVAQDIPFSISDVATKTIGNTGETTLEIRGAKFDANTIFQLRAADGSLITAETVYFKNSTLAYVTFDLFNQKIGLYDVQATQGNNTTSLEDVITVKAATGYDLNSNLTGPDPIRYSRNYNFNVNYGNEGDTDAIAPLLIVESATKIKFGTTIGGLASAPLQLLGVSNEGPKNILRPGDVNTLPVYFNNDTDQTNFIEEKETNFNVRTYSADNTTPIDWSSLEASIRPAKLTNSQWNNFIGNIAARVQTYGEYVKMLNNISEQVSKTGTPIYDVRELFSQLYIQQPNYLPTRIVSGQLLQAQTGGNLAGVEIALYSRVGESFALSAKTITDEQGKFSIKNLNEGEYIWSLTDKVFDQNRDGKVDEDSPSIVLAKGDVSNLSLYATDLPSLPAATPNNTDPLLLKDSAGVSHLIWKHGATLYQSYWENGKWQPAQMLGNVLGNNFSATAAGNLIDGNPGLIITWEEGVGNETEIYYAIGRGKTGGGYQWSDPIRLTNDAIADSAPSIAITGTGEALITYVKRNTEIQDDSDVYYSLVDVNSGELVWTTDTALTSSSPEKSPADALIEPASQQYQINGWNKKLGPIGIAGFGAEAEFQLSGLSTQDDCEATLGLNGKLKLDLDIGDIGKIESEGNGTLNAYWEVDKKAADWKFKTAQLDASAQVTFKWKDGLFKFFNGIPPLVPVATTISYVAFQINRWTSLKIENGINFGPIGFEAKDVRWKTSAPLPVFLAPDSVGEFSFFLQAGPYLSVSQKGITDTELGVSGSIGGKFTTLPKFKSQFTYNVQLTAKLAGWDAGSTQWGGAVTIPTPKPSSLDTGLLRYDPESVVGTANVYNNSFIGNSFISDLVTQATTNTTYTSSSILGNVTSDLLRDSAMVMSVDTDGTVFAIWSKDQDPFGTDIGSRLYATEFNGTNWTTPAVIPNSLGFNDSATVAVDANGTRLLVWSYTSTSTLSRELSLDKLMTVRDTADLYYSLDTGSGWTNPLKLAATTGKDRDVTIGKDSNGNVLLAWTYYDGNGGDVLMSATWNGTQWNPPTQVATGIISNLSIGSIDNRTHLYWTADTNSDPAIDNNSIMYAINDPTTGWSAAASFMPEIISATIATAELPTSSVPISTESLLPPFFPVPDDPKCKDKSDPDQNNPGKKDRDKKDDDNHPSGDDYNPTTIQPKDPNDILGPAGFGEERWIDTDEALRYTIRFENAASASAPAQDVVVTQQLDADLDWRTFRIDDYGWSGKTYELAGDRAFYNTRIDLTATKGFYVDVAATIDTLTGIATWKISTIDPATGEAPLDAQTGFLPTNDNKGVGEGFLTYTVRAKRTAKTGDVIDAKATIVFDTEEPIDTPAIFNTLDLSKPTSSVNQLPASAATPDFLVSWAGSDQGSAIASYTVYVSDNNGAFTVWLADSTLTESTYTGVAGHTYKFYTVAKDNAGNTQDIPTGATATIRIAGGVAKIGDFVWVDRNANGIQDSGDRGLANVTVNLYNTAANLVTTTTTNADGFYSFTNIPTSDYTVEVVAPNSYLFSDAKQGTNIALDSNVDPKTGKTDTFTANAGNNLAVDAGLYQLGSISGQKWHDIDGDGIKDATESGLKDWKIYLDTNTDGKLDPGEISTLTDDKGNYSFTNLRPGTYTVTEQIQPGWKQTYPGVSVTTTASAIQLVNPSSPLITSDTSSTTSATNFVNLDKFWADTRFSNIKGKGYSTVIIDTGADLNHPLFGADADNNGIADKIVYQYDFANNDTDASDKNNHGSHVASIASAVAPEANLIILKVFKDSGTGSFADLERALQWVNSNTSTYNIASVNLSLGDGQNWNTPMSRYGIGDELAAIASQNVLINAAAGNGFYSYNSAVGLAYPAIDPSVISVGAVWADDFGARTFSNGAKDLTTATDRIASFSQRSPLLDVFAPGILIAGANATGGTIGMGGTSQATPYISAIATLAQQIAQTNLGRKLTLAEFDTLLHTKSDLIIDGDDENDNVTNTGATYPRINVLSLAEGILSLPVTSPTTTPTNPTNNGNQTALNLPVTNLNLSHAVTLTSGDIKTNINFGNQQLNRLVRNDFNGDGKSDLLWRNDDGSVATWQMNGSTVTPKPIENLTPDWQIAGTGDFNGDGKSDIILQNTNGSVITWQMNGAAVTVVSPIGNATGWKAAGTGDFNGDGKSDILWRNDGVVALWQMDGSKVTASRVGTPSNDWKVAGTDDFDGDGKADILWQKDSGEIALWQMDGAAVVKATSFAVVPTGWKLTGTGDLNGDGKSDIILQNQTDDVAVWQMDGAKVTGTAVIGTAPANWNITGTGDLNGDGKADILWRSTAGSVASWQMDGFKVISAGATSIPTAASVWNIAAPIV